MSNKIKPIKTKDPTRRLLSTLLNMEYFYGVRGKMSKTTLLRKQRIIATILNRCGEECDDEYITRML